MPTNQIAEMGTHWHFCIKLDNILKLYLTGNPCLLSQDDGTPLTENEVYELVKQEKVKGYKYFSGCDNRDNEGKCKGHPSLTESQGREREDR